MLSALIDFSLNNRFLVIALVGLMAVYRRRGVATSRSDALPDMTQRSRFKVVTEAGVLAPLEVERYVTYPVEATMNGLPDVEEIRSVSRFGLSAVTIESSSTEGRHLSGAAARQ